MTTNDKITKVDRLEFTGGMESVLVEYLYWYRCDAFRSTISEITITEYGNGWHIVVYGDLVEH